MRVYYSFMMRIMVVLVFSITVTKGQIAVIAHLSNPITDISLDELRSIFKGDKVLLDGNIEILLVESRPVAEDFYQILYNKSRIKMKKYWIHLVFSGRSATPPEEKQTVEAVLDFVSNNPGSIAFIPLKNIDDRVKLLTVNGFSAGKADYPL